MLRRTREREEARLRLVEELMRVRENARGGWAGPDIPEGFGDLPDDVLFNLARARAHKFDWRNSLQSWREALYITTADGTAVTAAAETILIPDFTFPANYLNVGRCINYTLFGRMSTVITTPGTWIWRLRWGGVGGVAMVTSGTIVPDPTAASTNVAWYVEYKAVCRSVGTSGTTMGFGRMWQNDIDDGAAAVANLTTALNNQHAVFPDAAAVATVDTTIAKALSATITPSVATGSITCHMAVLESIN